MGSESVIYQRKRDYLYGKTGTDWFQRHVQYVVNIISFVIDIELKRIIMINIWFLFIGMMGIL